MEEREKSGGEGWRCGEEVDVDVDVDWVGGGDVGM